MHIGVITPQPGVRCCVAQERQYLRRVLETVRLAQEDDRFILFCPEEDRANWAGWVTLPVREQGGAGRIGALVGQDALARAVRRAQVDTLFCLLDNAPANPPVPLCLFLLDPWPWAPPKSAGAQPENPRRARRACQEARGIVVPSEYVRRRCLELFDAPLDKMIVAPPGIDPVLAQPHRSIVEPPYIVVAGDTCPSHNHARVLEACNLLSAEFPHTLVAAGGACGGEPAAWGPNVVRIERCPGAQLAGLYQNAAAVIIPDLHHGSGHRVLEALAAGAVVIAPKLDAIPEFSGNYALYYNHESTESLRRVIRRVLEEPPAAPAERQRAARRAREFTWERCAWKVASVFKRVAS